MRQPFFGLLVALTGSDHANLAQLLTPATHVKCKTRLAEFANSEPAMLLCTTG